MKKRDYKLMVEGKFNRRAIMQLAWVYMNRNRNIVWYSLKDALKDAWSDAKEYQHKIEAEKSFQASIEAGTLFPQNNLSIYNLYSNPCGDLYMGYVTK